MMTLFFELLEAAEMLGPLEALWVLGILGVIDDDRRLGRRVVRVSSKDPRRNFLRGRVRD
jgi:hypothetical protein